jgi:hypothetical protein
VRAIDDGHPTDAEDVVDAVAADDLSAGQDGRRGRHYVRGQLVVRRGFFRARQPEATWRALVPSDLRSKR